MALMIKRQALSYAAGLEPLIKENEGLSAAANRLRQSLVFTVTTQTRSGTPLQSVEEELAVDRSLDPLRPDERAREAAVRCLKEEGLEVLHQGQFALTVRGPAELVAQVLGAPLEFKLRLESSSATDLEARPPRPSALYLSPSQLTMPASTLSRSIDHFVFIPPPLFFCSPLPPVPTYPHVNVSALRRLLKVPDGAEQGQGVQVAMVDTGFFPHPFYTHHHYQYRAMAAPGAQPGSEQEDPEGHGTAMALNVFAVAPGAELIGIKYDNNETTPDAAFETARRTGARIITCSWGWDREQSLPVLEATIRDAVQNGVTVLFAAGNGHYCWPASMPDVLSVGGVFADPDNNFSLRASNYASGFMSSLYPGRRVPDVSGLCGQSPLGIYIPMPTQAGSMLDNGYAGPATQGRDGTEPSDGWAVASGTSAATAQVAGVVALMLERARAKNRALTPTDIRSLLEQGATAVQAGRNALRFPAAGHPNVACGYGLVDAERTLSKI